MELQAMFFFVVFDISMSVQSTYYYFCDLKIKSQKLNYFSNNAVDDEEARTKMKPNQRKSQHHMRTVTLPWAFFQGQA
jgi:hypothetical protein